MLWLVIFTPINFDLFTLKFYMFLSLNFLLDYLSSGDFVEPCPIYMISLDMVKPRRPAKTLHAISPDRRDYVWAGRVCMLRMFLVRI